MNEDIIGKELLGQFRIVERIGRGGMGEVYKAEQPAMDRLVAIKILHAKLAARKDLVSRFRREARAMSRLSHPNTARVFLYGQLEESEQLYIVMEYLEGVDLAKLVRRDGPMEVKRATNIIIQVLGALEEAHSVGIVHRDLKPENILLTSQGGIEDFPKVLDFGLAKIKESRLRPGSMILTQAGMVFGTPEFMSPEQAKGEILDAKSDVYSIGLIFYELLTGCLPFPKCKPMEYISHHIYTKPIPVTERVPELKLPTSLDPIIFKALEKNKEDRFQSAQEFAEALKKNLPRSMPRDPGRTLAGIRPEPVKATRLGQKESDLKEDAPPKAGGKTLVIAMLAMIFLLVCVVIWLLLSRTQDKAISTVPLPATSPPAQQNTPEPSNP